MDPQVFQQLVLAVILAIVSLLAYALKGLVSVGISYLQNKLGQTNFQLLQSFVGATVSFLEQSPAFQSVVGEEKKQRAISEIVKFCEDHKLPVDEALIDKLVEQAVFQFKKDFAPAPTKLPAVGE
jgi:hypothetical protein